jgi:hypothetical protein
MVEEYPTLQSTINTRLTRFLSDERWRVKDGCPSLGLLLPLLSVSIKYRWSPTFANIYLDESFSRNVLWACKKYPELAQTVVCLAFLLSCSLYFFFFFFLRLNFFFFVLCW